MLIYYSSELSKTISLISLRTPDVTDIPHENRSFLPDF